MPRVRLHGWAIRLGVVSVVLVVATGAGSARADTAAKPDASPESPVGVRSFDRRVLLIGTYERLTASTSRQEGRIRETLQDVRPQLQIRADYLVSGIGDLPELTPETRQAFMETLAQKWADYRPHMIIAIDTMAFDLLTSPEAKDAFPKASMVFSGVTWSSEAVTERLRSAGRPITGVLERLDLVENIRTIQSLQPEVRRVLVISPLPERSRSIAVEAERQLSGVKVPVLIWNQAKTTADLQTELEKLKPDGCALYLAMSADDPTAGAEIEQRQWPVPVYPVYESNLGKGMLGGLVISADAQGRVAGQMAARILSGENASTIPIATDADKRLVFQYPQLVRWGLTNRVPKEAIVLSPPPPLAERLGPWLWLGPILLAGQTLVIGALLVAWRNRRRAELKLAESEQRYALAVRGANDGLWDWDMQADRMNWATRLDEMLGYAPGELNTVGMRWKDLLHPEDASRAEEALRTHLDSGSPYDIEFRLKKKDGTFGWVRSRGAAVRNAAGQAVRMAGSLVDVQDIVVSRRLLEASEERFRATFFAHPFPMWVYDLETLRILAVNDAAVRKYGYSREEFTQKTILQLRPESETGRLLEFLKQRNPEHPDEQIWKHLTKDGQVLDVSVHSHTIPWEETRRARVVTAVDVTHRLRSEQLQDRQRHVLEMIAADRPLNDVLNAIVRLVQDMFTSITVSVLILNDDKRTVYTAAAPDLPLEYIRAVDGLEIGPQAGSCGTAMYRAERVVVDDIETSELWAKFRDFARPHGFRACWSDPIRGSDGSVLGSLAMYEKTPGEPTPEQLEIIATASHLAGIAIQRDQAQTAFRASEARYRQIVETAGEGIWVVDDQWRTTFVNKRLADMLGHSIQDMIGRHVFDFMDEEGERIALENFRRREQGISEEHSFRFKRADGSDVWTSLSTNPLMDDQGGFMGALAMVTDISHRREVEMALERERRLFLSGPTIAWRWKAVAGWPVEYVSENVGAFGYKPDDFTSGRVKFVDILHPDDLSRVAREVQGHIEARAHSFEQEYRIRTADGRWRWITDHTIVEWGPGDKPLYFAGHTIDVTERKEAERALAESERRFREIAESIDQVFWMSELSTPRRLYVSPAFERIWGIRADELSRNYSIWLNSIHPEDRERVERLNESAIAEKSYQPFTQEYRIVRPDGEVRWVRDRVNFVRDEQGRVYRQTGIAEDITAARQAQQALRESEAANLALIAAIPDVIFRMDRAGVYCACYAPDNVRLMADPETFIGRSTRDVLPRHLAEQCMYHLDQLFATGLPQTYEYEVLRADGTRACHEVRMTRTELGEAMLLVRNITDRRDAERRLMASEQRLSLLVNSVPVGVVSWGLDFTVTAWNPGAERVFGYTAEEAIGRHGSFIVPANARPFVDDVWRNILSRCGGLRSSNENVRKDGQRIFCDWYNSPLVDATGRLIGVASIVEDVTERRLMQQHQSLIMAELDHRVKNNLAAVLSLAEQTGRSATAYPEFMQKFTGRLKAMSRMHSALARSKWQGVDLRTLVLQTLEAFSPGESGRVHMSGPDVVLPSRAAQGMAMALNELATNAAKYGALSGSSGSVNVQWTRAEKDATEQHLSIVWTERGGPSVSPPSQRGFGSELIEGAIAHELRGQVELDFDPEGLVCRMSIAVPIVTSNENDA